MLAVKLSRIVLKLNWNDYNHCSVEGNGNEIEDKNLPNGFNIFILKTTEIDYDKNSFKKGDFRNCFKVIFCFEKNTAFVREIERSC